jgi:methionine sulfoxide reductase heme-binding subunit
MDRVNTGLRRVPTWVVWAAGALPVAWIVWLVVTNGLGPDPVREIEHRLGTLAVQALILTLAVTPLRWTGLNLVKFRRAIGVWAFFYVALHFTAWFWLDMGLRWSEIAADLVKRPYIIVGMVGLAALLPLALTSTNRAIRSMGPVAWRRLHRLTYLAALAGVVHWLMLVKVWTFEPLFYAACVAALLAARVIHAQRGRLGLGLA